MYEIGVTGYCGFPTFLMTTIKKAEEMGYDFRRDFKLRWCTVGGERHGQILRKSFEEDYGLKTIQEYFTADVGWAAFECREKNGMHFNDECMLIEVCDPETDRQLSPGEVGQIVVTRFDKVYPLIRFGTGDLASYVDEPCSCGRTTPRIIKIMGMIGEHIRVKSMFVHKREVEETLAKMPEIAKAQMVVSLSGHKDIVTFRIELPNEGLDKRAFCDSFTKTCQDVFKLRPDNIEILPTGTLEEGYQTFVDKRW
jgi:phenylacetate-CoA ligase